MAIRALSDGWVEAPGKEVRPLCRSPVLAVCAPSLPPLVAVWIPNVLGIIAGAFFIHQAAK